MEKKATLFSQKKKKTTLLHYAIGSISEKTNTDSAIRKSLGQKEIKEDTSNVVK